MRKLLVAFTATLALVVMATPAIARQVAQKCRTNTINGASISVCAQLNESDVSFHEDVEGLADWNSAADFYITFDYIRLLRINPGGGSTIIRRNEENVQRVSSPTVHCCFSTTWYNLCTAPGERTYYVTMRYRLDKLGGGSIGWQSLSSYQHAEAVCGNP